MVALRLPSRITDAPWRLSAAVPEDVLFASTRSNEVAGRVAVAAAAVVGLLVVAATRLGPAGTATTCRPANYGSRKVFDNSRSGMLVTDPQGRFLRVNPAFGQMLGRPPQELVGRHFPRRDSPR